MTDLSDKTEARPNTRKRQSKPPNPPSRTLLKADLKVDSSVVCRVCNENKEQSLFAPSRLAKGDYICNPCKNKQRNAQRLQKKLDIQRRTARA